MTEQPPPPPGYPPQPPGYPPGYPPPPPGGQAPNNYLVWSILVTLFCCLPFGIVAIVKSSQVNGLWAQGRYAEAQASADSAKKWVTWSVIVGLISIVIYAILAVAGAFNTSGTSTAMLAAMF